MAKIRIGTCSWKYESWRGLVYSDQAKQNYLREYARKYDTVEVDQWFWSLFGLDKISLPSEKVVNEYNQSVPDDFKFTIKIPNSITLTHFYRKIKTAPLAENPHFLSSDLFSTFLNTLTPIHDKIGVLMFQFEYLNKQKIASQNEFLDKVAIFLNKCDPAFNYAIEIRNPYYLNRKYFDFLHEMKTGHVFLQGYFMPDIIDVYQNYGKLITQTSVIRLHGPDRKGIETKSGGEWNKIIENRDDEISKISKIIENIHSRHLDIYANINNHYEGSAPITIEKIRHLLFGNS